MVMRWCKQYTDGVVRINVVKVYILKTLLCMMVHLFSMINCKYILNKIINRFIDVA